eukprot:7811295-Karenia_brevis.AAC.1
MVKMMMMMVMVMETTMTMSMTDDDDNDGHDDDDCVLIHAFLPSRAKKTCLLYTSDAADDM